ncbi:uncharacterized protein N7443_010031 [Penicillium atrosanguineum]|uniref:uncharacterized protein n=1 Tax=Penicillium atrosanguineum TaxID=1132637 RepID=UPI0023904E8D|nr:uncharacterized protein N7443_010031 [Penicillium atrosanguineum]KAJ5289778.1 hypothetical protein N7443_010031 [Penicillium atrosanguineum]
MSDNAHPGVRSLLAKFENGESPVVSPESRGRSPVSSATPGSTRPLSRVRASFVTVDGVIQSNPGSPLRKTSGRSDSPGIFGPQINADEVEARRQNVISPTPAGNLGKSQTSVLDQAVLEPKPKESSAMTTEQNEGNAETTGRADTTVPPKEPTPVKKEETAPSATKPIGSGAPAEKPAHKTVTKRPSNIHATKTNATSKPATISSKSPTNNAAAKPSAREVAKERSDALARKPSRVSMNPAARTAHRTTRGATPSQETQKTSPTNSQGGKPRTRSPTRSVRLPASATAPTQASSARLGSQVPSAPTARTSTTASTLARKPSTLKSAVGAGQTRTTNGVTASVRRQSSRPSLPAQSTQDRPSSRVSDAGAKPADGFLARMMRPTESSRSRLHDRPETKAPAKSNTVTAKASVTSMGRAPERSAPQAKTKAAPLQPQKEKSQASNKDIKPHKEDIKPLQAEESEKENIEESVPTIPEEPVAEEPKETVVEQLKPEVPAAPFKEEIAPKPVEAAKTVAAFESTPESVGKLAEPATEEAVSETAAETATEEAPRVSSKPAVKAASVETTTEPKDKAPEETLVVADVKKVEDIPTENVSQSDGVTDSEVQIEEPKEETKVVLAESAVEKLPAAEHDMLKSVPVVPEVSQSLKDTAKAPEEVIPTVAEETILPEARADEDVFEISKDATAPEPSVQAKEPATKETKSDTVDIDFASLNLS